MTTPDPEFEALLEYLRDERGFDYTGYKRPTLIRRVREANGRRRRARLRRLPRAPRARTPDEFAELFDTILINVTSFFRDPAAWEYVAAEIVPRIVEQRERAQPIRVWSAGCATGAEAYTLAMLFAEALGEDEFRERVKIYATDVDDDALALRAARGVHGERGRRTCPTSCASATSSSSTTGYSFRNGFRRAVIFGRNDLLQDPPISRVDLLVSRNTLMYFGQEAQDRILSNFFFALRPRGYLDARQGRGAAQPHEPVRAVRPEAARLRQEPRRCTSSRGWRAVRRRRPQPSVRPGSCCARPRSSRRRLAQIVVDLDGRVSAINHAARAMFGLSAARRRRGRSRTSSSRTGRSTCAR